MAKKKAKVGARNGTKGRPTLKDVKYRDSGRPTVMTPEVLQKLEEAFTMDFNDREACFHAGIGERTFYDHRDKNEDFRKKIDRWKNDMKMRSKKLLHLAINNGDVSTGKWYLEKKASDEYTNRVEHTGANGEPLDIKVNFIASNGNKTN
jgi:hypothetical protein